MPAYVPQRDAELRGRFRTHESLTSEFRCGVLPSGPWQNFTILHKASETKLMNWGWIARHTAVAIGLTFVVVAAVCLAVRLLVLGMLRQTIRFSHPASTSPAERCLPDPTRGTCLQVPCSACRAFPCRPSGLFWIGGVLVLRCGDRICLPYRYRLLHHVLALDPRPANNRAIG